jgi:hypothetical protein
MRHYDRQQTGSQNILSSESFPPGSEGALDVPLHVLLAGRDNDRTEIENNLGGEEEERNGNL